MPTLSALYRYPVKGLSPEPLAEAALQAGDGFPLDRRLAITNGGWHFDAATYQPLRKTSFVTLMQHESLAALRTQIQDGGNRLVVRAPDGGEITASLDDEASLQAFSAFLSAYLPKALPGPPVLVRSTQYRFTDVSVTSAAYMSAISLINLDSVRDLERAVGQPVDPLRFRANVFFEGVPAWDELGWVGRELMLGDVRVRILKRTVRCPATEVDPATGKRDLDVPRALAAHVGHRDMGVYAEVLSDGTIRPGDALTLLG